MIGTSRASHLNADNVRRSVSILLTVAALGLGTAAVATAADTTTAHPDQLAAAVAAHGRGDYATAARLLPPLIIGEAEITEAIARFDAACLRLKSGAPQSMPAKLGGPPQ